MKNCPFCAEEVQSEAIKCKHCGSDLTKVPAVVPAKPVNATNWKRVGIVSLVVLVAVIAIGAMAGNKKGGQSQTSPPAPTIAAPNIPKPVTTTSTQTTASAPKIISYEVVSKWNIPNGGVGEDIVIPTSYLNQADMTALGQTLKSDLQNDRNAFVTVYTDKKAEAMKSEVLGTDATQSELDFYDSHHVAEYAKNANTGYHNYDFGLSGFGGANDTSINY